MPPPSPFPLGQAPRLLLGATCALVLAVFWLSAHSGLLELQRGAGDRSYYGRLVQGFQDGRLSLKEAVPPGLAGLKDPYDPGLNAPYQVPPYELHDLSFYRGKLYLYFGATPALVLFWPWAAATGRYLLHRQAVAAFCSIGFLASVGLLQALWRRAFPAVSAGALAAGALALGLATSAPILLQRSEVYEVAISCAYALTMLALGAVWLALDRPAQRGRWLALASLAFGLAVGARPPALFGAAILLVPLGAAARTGAGRRELGRLAAAAALPLVCCGVALAIYNQERFGTPWEFGQRYQLATLRQDTADHFSPRYLWVNFRIYFLEPTPWRRGFPFIGPTAVPALPPGHGPVEDPFGILASIPVIWLALAAPLAWWRQPAETHFLLRGLIAAVALLFVWSALPLLLFYWNCSRYELEFVPAAVLLAVLGYFGVEQSLSGLPAWRWAARAGAGGLLAASIAFNLLAGLQRHATARCDFAGSLLERGQIASAVVELRGALRIAPHYAEAHEGLGLALARTGRLPEAIPEFQAALQTAPSSPDFHTNLANALAQSGRGLEAVTEYEAVCRLQPERGIAHFNLAYGLQLLGRKDEAAAEFQEAVRLDPRLGHAAP